MIVVVSNRFVFLFYDEFAGEGEIRLHMYFGGLCVGIRGITDEGARVAAFFPALGDVAAHRTGGPPDLPCERITFSVGNRLLSSYMC